MTTPSATYQLSWPMQVDRAHSIPGDGSIVAWSFVTPASFGTAKSCSISLAEFGSNPCGRMGSLSTIAGDLTGGIGGNYVFNGGTDVSINAPLGPQTKPKHGPAPSAPLQPSTRYFLNVANLNGGSGGVVVQLLAH